MPKRLTNEQFEKRAISIHGNKYDYSLVEYKTTKQKVKIICKLHGVFEQVPNKHLSGQGCILCGYFKSASYHRFNNNIFIKKSIEKHGNKYDYSLVNYKNNSTKIKIICHTHGVFMQSPEKHMSGKGCFKCAVQKRSELYSKNPLGWSVSGWEKSALNSKNFDSFKVYIIKCTGNGESFYKIGRTYRKTNERFRSTKLPYNYEIIKEYIFDNAKEAFDYENKLKSLHKEFKYIPLIFFNGLQECFYKINLHL